MRYVHYCAACDARSEERATEYQAVADRDQHRRHAHHGLRPADRIEEIPGPLAIVARALLGALWTAARAGGRHIAASDTTREIRRSTYWQQAVRLLAIGVGIIALLALTVRGLT
ncbi:MULTISPECIES: hypothetical protein [Streptomyces]|uniref:Uncharacterized protein n=2 Tax=Streptomyces rimosus subsp. rimosus TaxID=132474 RepID=L8EVI1_STRR1|nr:MULTISPECIES: hypothetical protein [Streptomyces]KOG84168.1 hypothetical protein ADK78_00815 [Kitasatospora aureofaciens]MYT44915.1 hypothetical protein [Streptomyces sp. SID5471]KOT27944.1 hypothetical protein ADK84_37280 [Streptomyces sp. NRRL WC-3701]KOT42242.1 hypothetical protein ADK42_10045 [Streptomyces rimosus subsp. rimosus]KOT68540.1 hypothetical protein ADK44_00710 [Streptomyces rimosus subsp. rimosus]